MKNAFLVAAAALTLGVSLWPASSYSHEVVNTTVTFDKEIVRILNRKCIACHSERNLSVPFTSYEQTRPWARAIEEEVLRRHMPPWRAVRGYGQFANDLALTSRELQFIVAWVEGNGPKTKDQRLIVNVDQGQTPESERLKPDFERWQLGQPDLMKSFAPYAVAPGKGDTTHRVVVDLELPSERWIRALEFKPGDRRVVRAAFFWLQETGQWLGSWTPWYGATTLPQQAAYRVPAGSHLVAEIHYRSGSEPIEDRDRLGVYFASAPPAQSPRDLVLEARKAESANTQAKKFTGSVTLMSEVNLLAFKPDLVPGVESVEISARKPGGTIEVLLLLRDILPQWPTPYVLKDPVRLPKNTELSWTAYYKDSGANQAPDTIKLTVSIY
jgi:hypothetical protein